MTMTDGQILALDALSPLLFGDGRSFGASSDESRARTLLTPLPSTVAGCVRTAIGTHHRWDWKDPASIAQALAVRIGPYGLVRSAATGSVAVCPAPLDAVPYHLRDADGRPVGDRRVMRLTPVEPPDGAGCDAPDECLPLSVTEDVKPDGDLPLWGWPDVEQWLLGTSVVPSSITPPVLDERVHVAIDPRTRTASTGQLFTIEYRSWEHVGKDAAEGYVRWSLHVDVQAEHPLPDLAVAHLGGERRPVTVRSGSPGCLPALSDELVEALTSTTRLRMMLLTPAIFVQGWRPGWIDGEADSSAPGALVGVRIVSAAVGRFSCVSGWNHDLRHRGPKPIRRMAPAGSVYFLALPRPLTEDEVARLWLTSVCDAEQDRRDGYGTAVWGVW